MAIDTTSIWDQRVTPASLRDLHELIQPKALRFITLAQKEGIYLRIPTNGGYISYENQNVAYNSGVSQLQGGQNYHNFGLAFDVLPLQKNMFTLDPRNVDGKRTLTNDQWERVGQIGKSLGFEWGGEWINSDDIHPKFDSAHFQIPRDIITLEELQELRKKQQRDLIILPEAIKIQFDPEA